MQSDTHPAPVSKGMLWAGWVMSALPALFLFVDGVMKLMKPAVVVETTVQLGYPESVLVGWGSSCSAAQSSTQYRAPPCSARSC